MMQGEVLNTILQVSLLVFVISSMLAMGLSLTLQQIVAPLRSIRLVVVSLAANFVAVPIVAWAIIEILSLDEGLAIGLTLMATAAGAPFLPKLAAAAKGSMAFSVGLMVLLMVLTVVYMPLVLPLMLSGVGVNPWDIASSLIFLMLLPLGIGLLIRARYEATAEGLQPLMAQTSTIAIALLLVAGVIVNFDSIVELIGTGGFVAIVLFLALALALGLEFEAPAVLADMGPGDQAILLELHNGGPHLVRHAHLHVHTEPVAERQLIRPLDVFAHRPRAVDLYMASRTRDDREDRLRRGVNETGSGDGARGHDSVCHQTRRQRLGHRPGRRSTPRWIQSPAVSLFRLQESSG